MAYILYLWDQAVLHGEVFHSQVPKIHDALDRLLVNK